MIVGLSAGALASVVIPQRLRSLDVGNSEELNESWISASSAGRVDSEKMNEISLRPPHGRLVKVRGVSDSVRFSPAAPAKSSPDFTLDVIPESLQWAVGSFGRSREHSPTELTDREDESPVPLSDYFVSSQESVWNLTSELIALLMELHESGLAVKPEPENIAISLNANDASLLLSASYSASSSSLNHQISSLLSGLREIVQRTGDSAGFLATIQSCIASLNRASPASIPSWIQRFSKGPMEPLHERLKTALSRCDTQVYTEVSKSCSPKGKSFTVRGYPETIRFPTGMVESIQTDDGDIYWSATGDFILRMPLSMSKNAAKKICKERAVLTELANEGLPVDVPLSIISSDMAEGCTERVILQESRLLSNDDIKSGPSAHIMGLSINLLETIGSIHDAGIVLGSIHESMFSIDGARLSGCARCMSPDGKIAVSPVDYDSDEEDDEKSASVDLFEEDVNGVLRMVQKNQGVKGIVKSMTFSPKNRIDLVGKLSHAKLLREEQAPSEVVPVSRSSIYEEEENVFSECMMQVEYDSPIPEPESCWTGTMSLDNGELVVFNKEPLASGASGTSYLSSDAKYVAKVLIRKPATGAELCRERAIMKALRLARVGSTVNVVDIDWTRSELRPACQSVIIAMENGGSKSLAKLRVDTATWLPIAVRMTQILQSVHVAGYLHGDTNLGNFVYSNEEDIAGSLQLIDFGLSSRLYLGRTLIPSKETGLLMKAQTRIKDIYMGFFLAGGIASDAREVGDASPIQVAINALRDLGENRVRRDSEPPYQQITTILNR